MDVAKSTTNGKPKLLTRLVKGVGHWLGPETPTGKAFVGLEKGLTKTFDRLGRSDRYLNFVGRTLNRGLRARAAYVAYQEEMLHAMRLPSINEIDELRAEVREIHDQMEAISCQLEIVLEALEGQRQHQHKPEAQKSANGSTEKERPS
jgi:hypothetical protein